MCEREAEARFEVVHVLSCEGDAVTEKEDCAAVLEQVFGFQRSGSACKRGVLAEEKTDSTAKYKDSGEHEGGE